MVVQDAILARLCDVFRHEIVVDVGFRALRAELQHDAHRCVRVDVRIVALEIHVLRVGEEEVVVLLHQLGRCVAAHLVALTVADVFAGDIREPGMHERVLHFVLDVFNSDFRIVLKEVFDFVDDVLHVGRLHFSFRGLFDGLVDALLVERLGLARAGQYIFLHHHASFVALYIR